MSIRDILMAVRDTVLTPADTAASSRLLARLDEVLAAIEALQVGDKITPAQALVRVEWRATLFPFELFAVLERAAPGALQPQVHAVERALRTCIGELAKSAAAGDSESVLQARALLLEGRVRLEQIAFELGRGRFSARLLKNGVLLSGLLGTLSVAYLRSDLGLRLLRVESLGPAAAYQAIATDGGELVPQPEYLDDFMREFSKFYFGHPNQFQSIYFDKPKDDKPTQRRTLLHKISLRNSSHGLVKYISTVDAVVDAQGESEFPWRRLTVTPKVSAQSGSAGGSAPPKMKSEGIGPALDFQWVWKAGSGLVISTGKRAVFHREEITAGRDVEVGERAVQAGSFVEPLYWKLERAPGSVDAGRYLQVGPPASGAPRSKDCPPPHESAYGWYEILKTPAQMRAWTATGFDEASTLEMRHRALDRSDVTTSQLPIRLGNDLAYYQRNDRLLVRDPRCGEPGSSDSDSLVDPLDGWPNERLALLLADEKSVAQPKGVDLLTVRLGIDLWQVPSGRRVAASTDLDGFLNPQGILAVSLTLNMPARLRYRVTLRVNGQPAATYHFAGLVPEHLDFHTEGEEQAVARLRRVFGVQN
jgi:hypothetical protein